MDNNCYSFCVRFLNYVYTQLLFRSNCARSKYLSHFAWLQINYQGRNNHTKESLVTSMIGKYLLHYSSIAFGYIILVRNNVTEKPMAACDMFVKITNELASKPYFLMYPSHNLPSLVG
jgi:hypothetical protein